MARRTRTPATDENTTIEPDPAAFMVSASTVSRFADEVGVQDCRRVRGVFLGAGLVAENPECEHGGADRAVVGHDRGNQGCVRGDVVGVEVADVDLGRTGLLDGCHLRGELFGGARGQYTVAPGASSCASSTPISLRPPKITTGPRLVSSTAAIITCASLGADGECNDTAHQ